MSNINDGYEVMATLTEDCQFVAITHFRMLRRSLKKFIGQDLIITIQVLKSKRSDRQNRYLWGCVIKFVRNWLYETQGIKYKPDYVYTWLRLEVLGEEPTVLDIAGREVIVMSGKRFSQMSTAEFSEAVETIRDKMAERGCIIPEPTKNNLIHEFLLDE